MPNRNFYTNDLSKYVDVAQQVLLSNDQPFSPTGQEATPPLKINSTGPNEKLSTSEMNSFAKMEQDIQEFNDKINQVKEEAKRS